MKEERGREGRSDSLESEDPKPHRQQRRHPAPDTPMRTRTGVLETNVKGRDTAGLPTTDCSCSEHGQWNAERSKHRNRRQSRHRQAEAEEAAMLWLLQEPQPGGASHQPSLPVC
ncbi:hypothetical protein O3P69_004520 [Scylla paramamosain]|uniref:Uncharacterized protein n=1 Tax=Scylla paramamosain TaxID=85552 RepID=A0AAW0UHU3_SCYPA